MKYQLFSLRTLFPIYFLLSLTATSFAQWELGPMLDLNIATSNLKPGSDRISSRVLWGIGFIANRNIEESFDLRLEPMYLQKGWKHKEFDQKYKAAYIELPVMLKYNIEANHSLEPYLLAGPSLGILLDSEIKFDDGDTKDRTDSFKKTDLGICLGGGVTWTPSTLKPFAELRYSIGITDVNDVDSIETKFRNRGFHIAFGIQLPINKE